MSSKSKTEVLIDGKIYTLSGYESEEYLQKIASYMNHKIAEFKKLEGYQQQPKETKSLLLELNIADDYFKAKKQIELTDEDLVAKEKEIYDLKHKLIEVQIKLEKAEKKLIKRND